MEQPKNNLKIIADKKNARMILPNMLTLIGVCIGLTSIRFALDGKFEFAIILWPRMVGPTTPLPVMITRPITNASRRTDYRS